MRTRASLTPWGSLSLVLITGAIWATWRMGLALAWWQGVALWIPLSGLIALGFWMRLRNGSSSADTSLKSKIAGAWLLLVAFAGIDASIVFGQTVWRPITIGTGVAFLLMGWAMDWTTVGSSPTWHRPVRKMGYYGLVVLGIGATPFIETYHALLLFSCAELFSPRLYEGRKSMESRPVESTPTPSRCQ